MTTNGAVTKYRIQKLEESIKEIHHRLDSHEEKQEEQFSKVYKSLNKIENHLTELQTEMRWVKKIALSFGAIAGFFGGFVSILSGWKPPF